MLKLSFLSLITFVNLMGMEEIKEDEKCISLLKVEKNPQHVTMLAQEAETAAYFYAGCDEKGPFIKLWDHKTGKCYSVVNLTIAPNSLAAGGGKIFFSTHGNFISIVNYKKNVFEQAICIKDCDSIDAIACDKTGDTIFLVSCRGVWKYDGKPCYLSDADNDDLMLYPQIACSPDGKKVAVSYIAKTSDQSNNMYTKQCTKILDLSSKEKKWIPVQYSVRPYKDWDTFPECVTALGFSPGNFIVCSKDKSIAIFDSRTWKKIDLRQDGKLVSELKLDLPDNTNIVSFVWLPGTQLYMIGRDSNVYNRYGQYNNNGSINLSIQIKLPTK